MSWLSKVKQPTCEHRDLSRQGTEEIGRPRLTGAESPDEYTDGVLNDEEDDDPMNSIWGK